MAELNDIFYFLRDIVTLYDLKSFLYREVEYEGRTEEYIKIIANIKEKYYYRDSFTYDVVFGKFKYK